MPDPSSPYDLLVHKWEETLQEALQEGNTVSEENFQISEDNWEEPFGSDPEAGSENTQSLSVLLPDDNWEEPLDSVKWEETSERTKWKETDLYPPLKNWLESTGFTVHGEVKDCDVAACRNGELTLIEIKRTINLELLLQLVRRQKTADTVYAAVLAPPTITRRWKELTVLLKRLEIGLILIHMERSTPLVQVAFHPVHQAPKRNQAATKALLTEMEGRNQQDLNTGGSNRVKLFTAYRLQALDVARILKRLGTSSPRQLTVEGSPPKTGNILRANHYGWFERVARSMYCLTTDGEQALVEYQHIFDQKKGSGEAG